MSKLNASKNISLLKICRTIFRLSEVIELSAFTDVLPMYCTFVGSFV